MSARIWGPVVAALLVALVAPAVAGATDVERHKTLELVFTAATSPSNPFATVLLKIEVTDPAGRVFTVEGFYDGDGNGGQNGRVWKARLCPYVTGTWTWRTVTGDAPDPGLADRTGSFNCLSGSDLGGIVAQGNHFKFQSDGHVFLVGNFLDNSNGLRTTHTFMSETTTDAQRDAIIARQRDFHTSNKANIYFANRGDYSGQSVTPWVGTASSPDRARMDLARWKLYDGYIRRFKDSKMLAEMWFFADDSNFGSIPQADQKRLIRYALARTSAFSHTMYVLALEWSEGFTTTQINALGTYFQQHNPWGRVVSVHSVGTTWSFDGQSWPGFIATQSGNGATADRVNSTALRMNSTYPIPHIDEEFGVLSSDSDSRQRANLWACLCGGAAGAGTGSDLKALQRFLNQSRIPFQRMSPANGLVTGGGTNRFCLTESGRHYLVYSQTGSFTLNLAGSGLSGRWFDPRDPGANLGGPFSVAAGSQIFTPPSSTTSDWVLWITDGSNLNSGATNPSIGATIVQVVVPPSGNAAPAVGLTAPADGSSFAIGSVVTISASASDSDGTVTKVEFFDGPTKIGEDTASPYSMGWNTASAAAGPHTLTARATDNDGALTVSSPVSVTLTDDTTPPNPPTNLRAP